MIVGWLNLNREKRGKSISIFRILVHLKIEKYFNKGHLFSECFGYIILWHGVPWHCYGQK
jgi:hypothetical protein